ncbi:MAG: 5-formyltetrahydrofolate cyclo-ligase [Burkholderiales bacterium]|nr:MAG: 5-formyltetrahydrofolate cyclo-ligase [Burkholderiales bacterium]
MTDDREAMRQRLLARREALPAQWRRRADARIVAALEPRLAEAGFECFGVFLPVRAEPDLSALYGQLRQRGARLALPRVAGRGRALEFGYWSEQVAVVPGTFGIGVPQPFEPALPEALIVPCVGFDRRGFRLGYGGGYYDITLAERSVAALGVAYACCEIANFEVQRHDRALDIVCTERGCVGAGFRRR